MANRMELVSRMWKFSAWEYMEFLKRHGIECFGLSIAYGANVAVYADEDKYLELSLNDELFNKNEKQLVNLLKLLENAIQEYASSSGENAEYLDDDL